MDKKQILEQIFEGDDVVQEFSVSDKSPVIEIKTIGYKDQIELESFVSNTKEEKKTGRHFLQQYSLEMLSRTVLSVGKKRFKGQEEAYEFLSNKPLVFLNRLIEAQQDLEKQVKEALGSSEDINETFFPKEKPLEESGPSPKE